MAELVVVLVFRDIIVVDVFLLAKCKFFVGLQECFCRVLFADLLNL